MNKELTADVLVKVHRPISGIRAYDENICWRVTPYQQYAYGGERQVKLFPTKGIFAGTTIMMVCTFLLYCVVIILI